MTGWPMTRFSHAGCLRLRGPPNAVGMFLSRLAGVLAPPLCVSCGALAPIGRPLCIRCGDTLRWLGHERASPGGVVVWAPLLYEGAARDIVAAVKFRGAVRLLEGMAAQIAASAPPELLRAAHLVPVPLHPARLRRRGFNQAERLARELGVRTGMPVLDCLERGGPGSTQVGRGRASRARATGGTFGLRPGAAPPRRALLVDDVVTTGATLAACADALRRLGSERVEAVTYARTPGR